MTNENENWREKFSESENGGRREGYRPQGNHEGYNGYGRPMRPRYNREDNPYQTSPRGGYRAGNSPSGEPERGYREGGYQPRPRYNREGNPYQTSPRGGYRADNSPSGETERGYREGGYRPRYNREDNSYQTSQRGGYRAGNSASGEPERGYREGGYQPRPRFNKRPRTAGYNPHAKYSMKKQIEYKEAHYDPDEPIRLNKYLANAGVCSRREADEFIEAGVVKVNGEIVTELGTKVKRSDTVLFHDQLVSIEKKVYILLNKPKDYVTTSEDPQNRKTVMDLVKGACRERIYPVGRLDRNTTGVLLLTNDGELATKLTHPQYLKKKIYHVYLDKNVTAADMKQIADGIELEDGEIHADAIEYASETDRKQVGIEIHSGRNRIVRRIFEHLGYRVIRLDRVFFAGLTKKNVRRGDWRFLTEKEVNMLRMGAFE